MAFSEFYPHRDVMLLYLTLASLRGARELSDTCERTEWHSVTGGPGCSPRNILMISFLKKFVLTDNYCQR